MSEIPKNQKSTIKERICRLYENELYTDVLFKIGPKDGTEQDVFPAHKAILAIGSTVFASMLYSGKEANPSSSQIEINPEITFDGFGNLLEFLYTDDVYLDDTKEALETYDAASRFQVPGLREKCEKFLLTADIPPQTVCKMLERSSSLNIQGFRSHCLHIIEENTQEVIQSEYFKTSSHKTIKTILMLEKVSVHSECDLFHALMDWVSNRSQPKKGGPNFTNTRQIVDPLLIHIRFLSMSAREFSSCIKRYTGLLKEKEALAIMMHITDPGSSQLPNWCNRSGARTFLKVQSTPNPLQQIFTTALTNKGSNTTFKGEMFSIVEITSRIDNLMITGIKLAWKNDRTWKEERSLEYSITAFIKNNNFRKDSNQTVFKDLGIVVKFTKPFQLKKGYVVSISAKITSVRGFTFFTYDTEKEKKYSNFPFSCVFHCWPLDCNFFAISEIHYDETGSGIHVADAIPVQRTEKKKFIYPLGRSCHNLSAI